MHKPKDVFALLGATVDTLHALLMLFWVIGLPLLFWHRWPRATYFYSGFSVLFVVINVTSQWLLGECVLTTAARFFWARSSDTPRDVQEWFTVRFSEWVFRMTPSHSLVKRLTELLILVSALGAFYSMRRLLRGHVFARHAHP